jgi:hypothetical protein
LSLPVLSQGTLTLSNGQSVTIQGTVLSDPAAGASGATINVPQSQGLTLTLYNSGTLTGTTFNVGAGTSVDLNGGTHIEVNGAGTGAPECVRQLGRRPALPATSPHKPIVIFGAGFLLGITGSSPASRFQAASRSVISAGATLLQFVCLPQILVVRTAPSR